jgi:hypothetical protein
MASVTIQTGVVNGIIYTNQTFQWLNTGANTCSVGGTWFTPSPCSVGPANGPTPGSATATAGGSAGTFTYTSACLEVGSPRIPVTGH